MRTFTLIIGLFISMTMTLDAYGQSFPDKVELIVPARRGGNLDILGRSFTAKWNKSKSKKFKIRVTNHSWEWLSGAIKRGKFVKTDGSQLAFVSNANASAVSTFLGKKLTPIAMIGSHELALIVPQSSIINTLAHYQKNKMIAVGVTNAVSKMAAIRTFKKIGVPIRLPRVQSTTKGLMQLAAGKLSAIIASPLTAAKRHDLKAIAVFSTKPWKTKAYKLIDTADAQGVPVVASIGYGIIGPSKLNESFTQSFSDSLAKLLKQPDFKEQFRGFGVLPDYRRGPEYYELQKKFLDQFQRAENIFCLTCDCENDNECKDECPVECGS